MAAIALRKKVVSIGHFIPRFCFQSLQIFLSVRSNQGQFMYWFRWKSEKSRTEPNELDYLKYSKSFNQTTSYTYAIPMLSLMLYLCYTFTYAIPMLSHIREFSPPPFVPSLPDSNTSHEAQIPTSRPKSQPQDPNPSLKAQTSASRLKSQPRGSNLSLKPQIPASSLKSQPWGSNHSLVAQIPA